MISCSRRNEKVFSFKEKNEQNTYLDKLWYHCLLNIAHKYTNSAFVVLQNMCVFSNHSTWLPLGAEVATQSNNPDPWARTYASFESNAMSFPFYRAAHSRDGSPQEKKACKTNALKNTHRGFANPTLHLSLPPNPLARLVAIVSSFPVTSFTEPQLMKMCFNGSCGSLRGAFVDRQPGLTKKP